MPESFTPNMHPENLEAERTRFAAWVVDLAAHCRDNAELIERLRASLPADFLIPIGEGVTRRVYGTKLGVVVKLQRESPWLDPLSDSQLQSRGGEDYLLELNFYRRMANLAEIAYAISHPRLMPRQYGCLLAFGLAPQNPSIIVAETCKPLSHYFPTDKKGIDYSDIAVDENSYLQVFDPRITTASKPDHLKFGEDGQRITLCNLGVTASGHFVFIDRSHEVAPMVSMNQLTFIPKEWNGGWLFTAPIDKTIELSQSLMAQYKAAWDSANPTERKLEC